MDTKTYICLMASIIAWICFLAQSLISFILIYTDSYDSFIREKLGLISIGINTGIARIIMEYVKNTHLAYW